MHETMLSDQKLKEISLKFIKSNYSFNEDVIRIKSIEHQDGMLITAGPENSRDIHTFLVFVDIAIPTSNGIPQPLNKWNRIETYDLGDASRPSYTRTATDNEYNALKTLSLSDSKNVRSSDARDAIGNHVIPERLSRSENWKDVGKLEISSEKVRIHRVFIDFSIPDRKPNLGARLLGTMLIIDPTGKVIINHESILYVD